VDGVLRQQLLLVYKVAALVRLDLLVHQGLRGGCTHGAVSDSAVLHASLECRLQVRWALKFCCG